MGMAVASVHAAPAEITVSGKESGPLVSPMLYGIFFEEINCAGDGGIYAELVRNRSFEESEKPEYWKLHAESGASASMQIEPAPFLTPSNRHCLKLNAEIPSGRAGVVNEGYWGMSVKKGDSYLLTFEARSEPADLPVVISLESASGGVHAREVIKRISGEWGKFEVSLKSKETDPRARLVIAPERSGTLWLDVVSLFPADTWKKSGLRMDLAKALDDLQPAFVRFPGGCWVEGDNLSLAYRWKQTIGRMQNRRTQYNIWQYYSTHGLGYHEYLQMCEDLKAEPLFVVNCGMSHKENVPMTELGPWVQDALDAIEYANGPADSRWGTERARNGHPKPFNLRYIEIGNENGGPAYNDRYMAFYRAIKLQSPGMRIIANDWGGVPTNAPVEIVDEHYYSDPGFFIRNANKYDTYPRSGPRIYVGEYAVTQNGGQGNLRPAVAESVFMMGMERNSDVVVMSSYAPLFANVNYKKWNPDLINFDSSRVYGTPSYYVQKLFAENRPDVILRTSVESEQPEPEPAFGGIGLGTWNTQAEFKDIRVATKGETLFQSGDTADLQGWNLRGGNWEAHDGVIAQSADGEDRRATIGDKDWADYILTLKARKRGGAEGFLIMFHVQDPQNWFWWNLGGWGNNTHAIEQCVGGGKSTLGRSVAGKIETGRWYDIKIELTGSGVRCYLDGKLIHDAQLPPPPLPIYAIAGRSEKSGELILKIANVSNEICDSLIKLEELGKVASSGSVTVLTSANPNDENSLEQPRKVAPVTRKLTHAGTTFNHSIPAHSLAILRLKTAP